VEHFSINTYTEKLFVFGNTTLHISKVMPLFRKMLWGYFKCRSVPKAIK
jgi:hypothetical protein